MAPILSNTSKRSGQKVKILKSIYTYIYKITKIQNRKVFNLDLNLFTSPIDQLLITFAVNNISTFSILGRLLT